MRPPSDVSLPFFAYGLFRPGQLGFIRIQEYVDRVDRSATAIGDILLRDGLPILVIEGGCSISGSLIWFASGRQLDAYASIAAMEPERLYKWESIAVSDAFGARISANALLGVKPMRGSGGESINAEEWDGTRDPLFTTALDVVRETLEANEFSDDCLRPFFRLQMAYLLLWTAIERYASLRYNLGKDVLNKIWLLADEPAFREALHENVRGTRKVFSAKDPEDKFELDDRNPKGSLKYYYQVRSNITHRGKGVNREFEAVKCSLQELLPIFRKVLDAAFRDAANRH